MTQPTDQHAETYIHKYMTQSTWCHFDNALDIGKVKLFAGTYRKGQGANQSLTHYINADDLRPILHDLSWGKSVDFTDYKGGQQDGKIVSRILTVKNTSDGKVFWSFTHGPGRTTKTGAVMPMKVGDDQKTKVNVMMTADMGRVVAYKLIEYLQAWQTAQLMGMVRTQTPPSHPTQTATAVADTPRMDATATVVAQPEKKALRKRAPHPPVTTKMRNRFHQLGMSLYSGHWTQKRAALCVAVTDGETNSSKELNAIQMQKLIEGMVKKQTAGIPPAPKADIERINQEIYG